MKLIDRPTYTERIEQWLGKGLVIVLTGQRRVGKSMCLRLVAERQSQNKPSNIVFILLAIPNNYPKIVVSLNPLHTQSNYEGITHLHLREFLKCVAF